MKSEQIRALLSEAKLRITPARIRILEIFAGHHGPFSADQLYREHLKKKGDLVTLYRTLTTLHDSNILRRCDFGDGVARFELADLESDHHHHHLICKKCQKTEVINRPKLIEELENQLSTLAKHLVKESGFFEIEHQLEFFGVCSRCHKKSKPNQT
jgi:Fe2+ or Zn2+ uptake regulation protein